jgi:uncharacterized membrane protein
MTQLDSRPGLKLVTLQEMLARRKPVRNINKEHTESLSRLDRLACWITDKVGTMGFFLLILFWTVLWTGYNILASEVAMLHWRAFDPFPAFVAYLLISNVIQILLMPLIMVGQNLQGRHSEKRAENDFEINIKAEQEIEVILRHLEHQQFLLMQLVQALGVKLDTALGVPTAVAPTDEAVVMP